MEAYLTMINQNNFYVGDVEDIGDNKKFVRVNFDEIGLKKLNNILNSQISMNEWITIVVDKNKKVEKIVVFSEKDNKEYEITQLFSTKLLNKLLN